MSLGAGARLGPYEIVAAIGAGGMGEVYRARDTRLKREVALKILPASFAGDPDRLARFQREAEVLASLNHPNIAAIYGLEESDGVRALVMELVEGETLADRIARGAIPIDEALPIAKQIADALEAAHERGIIHRDLKPANIKVRPEGTVKVLDFGLAKLAEAGEAGEAGRAGEAGGDALSLSPTITSPALMTGVGVLLGTAAYMAPEQAKGKPADKRSDIWAFGCILYEMLTGKRAFEGDDVADTLANVLKIQPEWTRLPPLSASTRALLQHCLEKDRHKRIADISTARFVLSEPSFAAADVDRPNSTNSRSLRFAAMAAAIVATAGITAAAMWLAMRPATPQVTRTAIAAIGEAAIRVGGQGRDLAIAPDGSKVVYVGGSATRPQLFVRALNDLDSKPLTPGPLPQFDPFFSPDGRWVGFIEGTLGQVTLKKVPISGGPAVTLCRATSSNGGTWASDGTIILSAGFGGGALSGLQQISESGCEQSAARRLGPNSSQGGILAPHLLPGGRAVLFTIRDPARAGGFGQIALFDFQTGKQSILVREGSDAVYVDSGHLVYGAAGTLRAVPFDLDTLSVMGAPVPVVPQLVMKTSGLADFDVAGNGTLVYVAGSDLSRLPRMLLWRDRNGKEEAIQAPARPYQYPRLSPDGRQVAFEIPDEDHDIWSLDIGRASLTRLTSDPTPDRMPVWTRDSRRVVFTSNRVGPTLANIFSQGADGSGPAERLTSGPDPQFPTSTSPDGKLVIFWSRGGLMTLGLDAGHRVQPLVSTTLFARNGEISPDGHWLAYESNESGQFEIYVRPFPDANGGRWQISTGGGNQPLWSRDGGELFYVAPSGSLMSERVQPGKTWSGGSPTKLFEGNYFTEYGTSTGRTYDVSVDGRFLLTKIIDDAQAGAGNVVVVQNWREELKRLVPPK